MTGGFNVPIPGWLDVLGWVLPGKAYNAIHARYIAKKRAAMLEERKRQYEGPQFGPGGYPLDDIH